MKKKKKERNLNLSKSTNILIIYIHTFENKKIEGETKDLFSLPLHP